MSLQVTRGSDRYYMLKDAQKFFTALEHLIDPAAAGMRGVVQNRGVRSRRRVLSVRVPLSPSRSEGMNVYSVVAVKVTCLC